MSGVSIEVKIDDHELRQLFSRLSERVRNLRPAYKAIGEYMLRETAKRFEGEHDPEGKPWHPLSPRTLRYKRHPKILTERGNLRGRITYRAEAHRVIVGTNVIYARIHQLGGKAGRGGKVSIPARPFLGVNEADRREIIETLKDYILKN